MPDERCFVRGEIDIANAEALRAELLRRIDRPGFTGLRVDCYDLEFIDCAGVGALMDARSIVEERGYAFRVVNVATPIVRRLLDLLDVSYRESATAPLSVEAPRLHFGEQRVR
jgi:anti-anti-sigma factor